jgi:uncharacterized protein (TIGR00159 family)
MKTFLLAKFQELMANVRLADALDILIIAIILYAILIWFKHRASRAIVVVLSAIITLYILARLLNMYMTSMLFHVGIAAILVMLILIFQVDIRRTFERVAASPLWGRHTKRAPHSGVVDKLVEAANRLSEKRIGALIVLPGRESMERHIRGGLPVNADLSQQLLQSIFNPASPGHDGAVIVDDGHIVTLGVHLPLSANLRQVSGRGTRHAAALGLSELCDALLLVVSEEQGTISIAQQGKLFLMETPAELKTTLERFYHTIAPQPIRGRTRSWLRANTGLKASALVLSCLLWMLFAYRVETVYRTVEIPIEYRNLPQNLTLREPLPTTAKVTLSGPERNFSFNQEQLKISVDMATLDAGQRSITITNKQLTVPQGLDVTHIEPAVIQFSARTTAPTQ